MVKREVIEKRDRAIMLKHMARHMVSHMPLPTWTNGGLPWRSGTKKGPIKRQHVEMGTRRLVDKLGSKREAIIWDSSSFFNTVKPTYKKTRQTRHPILGLLRNHC